MSWSRALAASLLVALAVTMAWAPAPSPEHPERPERRVPATPMGLAPSPSAPSRGDDLRRDAVTEVEADGLLAGWVQGAMARDGDSDPRLLDAIGALGLRPTALLTPAVALEPWLGAGLVDLERQVASRCRSCGWDPADAAAELVESVDDDVVDCVVGRMALGWEDCP